MVEMKVVYLGPKKCELTHTQSGAKIETDAPKDNGGSGSRFSPTDLMAASLASCALTTMAIVAEREGFEFGEARAVVEKHMHASPRRIARLPLKITMPKGLTSEQRSRMEFVANGCPVAKSLDPEIAVEMQFIYLD